MMASSNLIFRFMSTTARPILAAIMAPRKNEKNSFAYKNNSAWKEVNNSNELGLDRPDSLLLDPLLIAEK